MTGKKLLFLGKPSLTLTGFMFSGKTSVGRELAHRLRMEFVDLDTQVVSRAGKSIERIFQEDGEQEFRRLEREAVVRTLPGPGRVIAAGGGAILDPANLELMHRHSCIIWLRTSAETVIERWRSSRGRVRPLLSCSDPETEVRRLLAERRQYYEQSDLTIETDSLAVVEVTERIIEILRKSGTPLN